MYRRRISHSTYACQPSASPTLPRPRACQTSAFPSPHPHSQSANPTPPTADRRHEVSLPSSPPSVPSLRFSLVVSWPRCQCWMAVALGLHFWGVGGWLDRNMGFEFASVVVVHWYWKDIGIDRSWGVGVGFVPVVIKTLLCGWLVAVSASGGICIRVVSFKLSNRTLLWLSTYLVWILRYIIIFCNGGVVCLMILE
jgi:hypothetical protein